MKKLLEKGPRWSQYATEIVSIVIGVLLALAANAGYLYLADRTTEREIIRALRVEFEADVKELSADQAHRKQKLASIDLLTAVRKGEVGGTPPIAVANALIRTLEIRFYTASHPVLDELLTTGQLDLIRSDDLRHALMAFGQERSRVAVVEQREREFVFSQLEPYLAARLDLGAVASGSQDQAVATLPSITDILSDNNFGSLLYLDRVRTETSLGFADRLVATVDGVRRVLGEGN